jgi:hypothetical protein
MKKQIITHVNVLIVAIRTSTNTWRIVVMMAHGIGMAKRVAFSRLAEGRGGTFGAF